MCEAYSVMFPIGLALSRVLFEGVRSIGFEGRGSSALIDWAYAAAHASSHALMRAGSISMLGVVRAR